MVPTDSLLAPGSHELLVSRIGYGTGRATVRIEAGQSANRDFRLSPSATALEAIVAVGTRRPDRVATEAAVPVDVVTSADIVATGLTETSQIIQRLAPSVNFPRATIADGTDHVRPATLRGLAPDQVLVLDGPQAGSIAAVGAQVFPGFLPSDAKDVSRNSVARYVDVDVNPLEPLLLTFAGRTENFSDFGSTLDGRVAARFEPVVGFALRASAGTGFRAPSLQQQYFSSTATNFIAGQPFDIRTFPAESDEAKVLGAQPLRAEESTNYSVGVVITPLRDLLVTLDAYRIDIDDRIVFSENFTGAAVQRLFRDPGVAGFAGVTGGRFFTNAIDTRTEGIDIVAQYAIRFGTESLLRFTGGVNFTETEVLTDRVETPAQLRGLEEALFGRVERGRVERGQPGDNVNLNLNYTRDRLGVNFNNHRFGEVSVFGTINPDTATGANQLRTLDQTFDANWITDLDLSYRIGRGFPVAVGANNLFDVYPEQNFQRTQEERNRGAQDNSNNGIFLYDGVSPFGFNGAFYYVRFNYRP